MEDRHLLNKAKARVRFKRHALIYICVNTLLWCIWIITNWYDTEGKGSSPWPIFPLAGCCLALAFEYIDCYCKTTEERVQEEYKKLKKADVQRVDNSDGCS